jgi:hypothetical protein
MAAVGNGGDDGGAGAGAGNGGDGGGSVAADGVVMTKSMNIKALMDHWQSEVIRLIADMREQQHDTAAAEHAYLCARRTTDTMAGTVRERVDPARNSDPDDIFIQMAAEALQDEREANITLDYSRIREVCIHQCIYFFAILQHVFSFLYRRIRSSRTSTCYRSTRERAWSIYRVGLPNYELFFVFFLSNTLFTNNHFLEIIKMV